MIKCSNCKRETGVREPTGLKYMFNQWTDKFGNIRKDIISQERVCIDCCKV